MATELQESEREKLAAGWPGMRGSPETRSRVLVLQVLDRLAVGPGSVSLGTLNHQACLCLALVPGFNPNRLTPLLEGMIEAGWLTVEPSPIWTDSLVRSKLYTLAELCAFAKEHGFGGTAVAPALAARLRAAGIEPVVPGGRGRGRAGRYSLSSLFAVQSQKK